MATKGLFAALSEVAGSVGLDMEKEFVEAIERTITHLVADFQAQTTRFWNERDLHWCLFHYLKQDPILQRDCGTELIRAEFPTRAVYIERKVGARGHYDLVILNPTSLISPAVSDLPPWASWGEYLPLVDVLIAVEVKTWVERTTDIAGKVDWDIEKLTDERNAVENAYFLNFVQLDFSRQQMRNFYQNLREYLMGKARCQPKLRILCVPHDKGIQPHLGQDWIH